MAISPGHKFGQLIGEVLEMAIEPILSEFAKQQGLFLDKKGPRPVRDGQKVCWTDLNGNKHDLDFVLERGGTPDRFGVPVAFIEAAWRRYTKHSRNKAQEIQGAILPLFTDPRALPSVYRRSSCGCLYRWRNKATQIPRIRGCIFSLRDRGQGLRQS
jgi:hypothetical protein